MKLSIVTICLNEKEKIERTLKSVSNQTYSNIEYIVIDGGSNDGTQDVIKKYSSNIDLFISEKDQGIFDAQNKGIAKANGDYILILNAGDYLYKTDVISRIMKEIKSEDIVYGDVVFELKNGLKYRKNSPHKITPINMFAEAIPHPATIYKKTLFQKIGKYDINYKLSADYDYMMKCVFKHKVRYKYINIPISVFNLEGVSSDEKHKILFQNERQEIQKKYYSGNVFLLLKLFSPLIIFFRKKIYYLYYYLKSKFDKRFMEIN